jgi:hypothetical protein
MNCSPRFGPHRKHNHERLRSKAVRKCGGMTQGMMFYTECFSWRDRVTIGDHNSQEISKL